MATLDDKLLGEKLDYYCSSSEDEGYHRGRGEEYHEDGEQVDADNNPALDLDDIYSVKTGKVCLRQ